MDEAHKELVKRLRDVETRERILGFGGSETLLLLSKEAADAIEALAGDLKDRTAQLVDAVANAKQAHAKAQTLGDEVSLLTTERDRLKAVLKPRLNAKAIEGLQEILEAMEAMDEREAPFLKTLLDWHEAVRNVASSSADAGEAERDRLKAEYDAYRETSCESIDRLKAALERLGSVEAFTSSQGICPELYERITYARKALGDAS